MSDPKLSVIMPVYNTAAYLEGAIGSILAQSFTDFELIAVNDGSTDASAEILDRLAAQDPRLVVIHQENSGVSKAANTAIAAARGIYIARMDSDDIAWPERFAQQVAALEARPEVVALGTQFRLIDPEGRVLKVLPVPCDHATLDAQLMREQSLAICNPSVMMRTDAVNKVGRYSERFSSAHDIDLFLRLAEVGELANLEMVLLDYRLHMSSIGYSGRPKQIHNAWIAGKEAAARRGVPFEVPEPVAGAKPRGMDDIWRKWGWWALGGGNVATARHYARLAVKKNPLSGQNWRLALMALRGH